MRNAISYTLAAILLAGAAWVGYEFFFVDRGGCMSSLGPFILAFFVSIGAVVLAPVGLALARSKSRSSALGGWEKTAAVVAQWIHGAFLLIGGGYLSWFGTLIFLGP